MSRSSDSAQSHPAGSDIVTHSIPQPPAATTSPVRHTLAQVALVVRDYDEAIAFFVDVLGFELVEDTPVPEQAKRWVVVRPHGGTGASLLLARAASPRQVGAVGEQAGGRVFLFLHTDDLDRDVAAFSARGVRFARAPASRPYGRVAVFEDVSGNLWDLIEPAPAEPS